MILQGETDVFMRSALESVTLNGVRQYRDKHLVLLDRVVLCIIGGIATEKLKPTIEGRSTLRSCFCAILSPKR